MFRIVFIILALASVVFAVYNPVLPGILLLLVELLFAMISAILFLQLEKGTRIYYREDPQGCSLKVENHSNVPLVRMYLEVSVKERWTGRSKKIKLAMQADSQSEEVYVISSTRLSGLDDYYDGVPYINASSQNQELNIDAPVGANDMLVRRVVYYEPLGLFRKSMTIGKSVTLYQFPEWVNIPLPDEADYYSPDENDIKSEVYSAEDKAAAYGTAGLKPHLGKVLIRTDLSAADEERIDNRHIEVFMSALLSFGLGAVSRGRQIAVSVPRKEKEIVNNEEDMYRVVRSVMESKLGDPAPEEKGYDTVITLNLKPAVIYDGRETGLTSKGWKRELQALSEGRIEGEAGKAR